MTRFFFVFRNAMFWGVVLASAMYFAASALVDSNLLQTTLHAISFSIWIAVGVTYLPGAILGVLERRPTNADYLIIGIVCAGLSTALMRGWSAFYRILGRPEWMFENPIFGYLILLGIFGGVIHLTAPGAIGGRVPARNWIKVGIAIGIGAAMAISIVWLGTLNPFGD